MNTFNRFADVLERIGSSDSKSKVKEPEPFDGNDPRKLRTFLVNVHLNLNDRPNMFRTDAKKIAFVLSYLTGPALDWFEPEILDPDPANPPAWSVSFQHLIKELQDNFGVYDAVGDAESKLSNLYMKDSDRLNKYTVKFNQYAALVHWDHAALHYFFHKGLAPRLKDELVHVAEARTLRELRKQVSELDNRYWQRHFKRAREQKSHPSSDSKSKKSNQSSNTSSSSNNKSNSSNSSGGSVSGSGSGKPQSNSNSGGSNNSSNNKKPYADKLGKDGKLNQAERDRRRKNNLCMFCGGNHKLEDCNKRKKAQDARGRAASASKDDTSSSAKEPEK